MESTMPIHYCHATPNDLNVIEQLVAEYHRIEKIQSDSRHRLSALAPLLDKQVGCIWVAHADNQIVAYLALCYGFSIEFGGRDAYVDELFVLENYRNRGIGHTLVNKAIEHEESRGTSALYLEVREQDLALQSFYLKHGFKLRNHFKLMSCEFKDID